MSRRVQALLQSIYSEEQQAGQPTSSSQPNSLGDTVPRSEGVHGGLGRVPEAEQACAGKTQSPRSLPQPAGLGWCWWGRVLVVPLELGAGEPAGGLAPAPGGYRGQAPGERGGCGFPVTLRRTAVTSRGLLGAVRAGGEDHEPCTPAWVRIPSWTLETLHQLSSQRVTIRQRVASPPRATACGIIPGAMARPGQQHPVAVGHWGLPKLNETPDDPGFHHPTRSPPR